MNSVNFKHVYMLSRLQPYSQRKFFFNEYLFFVLVVPGNVDDTIFMIHIILRV